MEVNGHRHILQNIFFCIQQKKETHTGLERYEGESVFHFCVICPFKKTWNIMFLVKMQLNQYQIESESNRFVKYVDTQLYWL